MVKYCPNGCPVCGNKLAETMTGIPYCPTCEGKQMAKETGKKLKLNLALPPVASPTVFGDIQKFLSTCTEKEFDAWLLVSNSLGNRKL